MNPEGRRRPHLVLIAFYFPPSRASGVFRARAIANHFARSGWSVTVISPQEEFFREYIRSVDESLLSTLDANVRVDRVRFSGRHWEQDLRRYSRLRGNFPITTDGLVNWASARFFPERYASWIPRVVRHVAGVNRRDEVDLVLATGNPYSSFAAAYFLNRFVRIPFVVDYRDSWTLDQFNEDLAFPPEHSAYRWESRILKHASRAVFVNQAQRDWHAQRYPTVADRMVVAENGFDEDTFGAVGPTISNASGRPIRFGFIGTITEQTPIQEFLDGWRLARQGDLVDAEFHIYGHLGFFPNHVKKLLATLPTNEGIGVTYHGPVPKAAIGDVYARLDALAMIIPSSRFVTAGKVYEYMAAARPIVAVHEPWTGSTEPLRGYPLWFPVRDMEPESVRDAITAAASAARSIASDQVESAWQYALRYARSRQFEALERDLRELVA